MSTDITCAEAEGFEPSRGLWASTRQQAGAIDRARRRLHDRTGRPAPIGYRAGVCKPIPPGAEGLRQAPA